MKNRMVLILLGGMLSVSANIASANTWMIGDNDGYGAGIADNANHNFNGYTANYDGRSAAEISATNGAQFTDTYSTTHPGYSPQTGTVATFIFSGLGNGWTEGSMWFDMADFQAGEFGAVKTYYNGILQNWSFQDGFPTTKVRYFDLGADVLASINSLGMLTVTIDRNNSGDFYGFDFALLSNDIGANTTIDNPSAVPLPAAAPLLLSGLGVLGFASRRRKAKVETA